MAVVIRRGHSASARALVAVMVLALTGCAAQEAPPRVDDQLLAALGLAQSYQHQADELIELGQRDAAIAKVRQVLEIPFPRGAPEREDVRLDAYGRLAELDLDGGDEAEAMRWIETGLSESTRTSYFKARLFAVRGRVLRARAASLRAEGRDEESRDVSRQAIEAFEQSIDINRQVLGMDHEDGSRQNATEDR